MARIWKYRPKSQNTDQNCPQYNSSAAQGQHLLTTLYATSILFISSTLLSPFSIFTMKSNNNKPWLNEPLLKTWTWTWTRLNLNMNLNLNLKLTWTWTRLELDLNSTWTRTWLELDLNLNLTWTWLELDLNLTWTWLELKLDLNLNLT